MIRPTSKTCKSSSRVLAFFPSTSWGLNCQTLRLRKHEHVPKLPLKKNQLATISALIDADCRFVYSLESKFAWPLLSVVSYTQSIAKPWTITTVQTTNSWHDSSMACDNSAVSAGFGLSLWASYLWSCVTRRTLAKPAHQHQVGTTLCLLTLSEGHLSQGRRLSLLYKAFATACTNRYCLVNTQPPATVLPACQISPLDLNLEIPPSYSLSLSDILIVHSHFVISCFIVSCCFPCSNFLKLNYIWLLSGQSLFDEHRLECRLSFSLVIASRAQTQP